MASSNSNRKYKPSGRFMVSYKALSESTANPNSAAIRDRTEKDLQRDPLSRFNQWPLNEKPSGKPKFIKRDKTTRKAAIVCLDELKANYFVHTLTNSINECPSNQNIKLEDYFHRDKLGLKKIDETDTLCWKMRKTVGTVSASATATSTSPPIPDIEYFSMLRLFFHEKKK